MQPFPEPSSLSSSLLPTNSLHCDGLHELLLAAHILPFSSTGDPPLLTPVVPNDVQLAPARTITTRKRTARKDRHSKIYTAQGPRDRRMRLSLEVARRFFDLQDMLGFDKPSKTVQWLLNKSKPAIRDLAAVVNPGGEFAFCSGSSSSSQSSTSECQDKFTSRNLALMISSLHWNWLQMPMTPFTTLIITRTSSPAMTCYHCSKTTGSCNNSQVFIGEALIFHEKPNCLRWCCSPLSFLGLVPILLEVRVPRIP